ncbi:unnamed protein product [Symbiodinium sp. KB8]|nr:unnamed protein product [Symbiodinium sp. KB8]
MEWRGKRYYSNVINSQFYRHLVLVPNVVISCYTLHEEVLASRQINVLRDYRDAIMAFLIATWGALKGRELFESHREPLPSLVTRLWCRAGVFRGPYRDLITILVGTVEWYFFRASNLPGSGNIHWIMGLLFYSAVEDIPP